MLFSVGLASSTTSPDGSIFSRVCPASTLNEATALLGAGCMVAFLKGFWKIGLALLFGVPIAGMAGLIPGVGAAAFAEVFLATGWTLFHILIISLQAYIFMTLTVVYMAMAADHH